jgi:hypothetical protein
MPDKIDPRDSKRRGPGVEEGAMGNTRDGEPIENIEPSRLESVEDDKDDSAKRRSAVEQP